MSNPTSFDCVDVKRLQGFIDERVYYASQFICIQTKINLIGETLFNFAFISLVEIASRLQQFILFNLKINWRISD